MRYEVKLTPQATQQIEETVQYISKILFELETARKWANTLQSEIQKLDSVPYRGRTVAHEGNPQNAR